MAKPHKLWRALDQCPICKAILAEWKRLLGDDFESVRSFLVATGSIAGFFPAQDSDSLPWRVVEHDTDDLVAVCQESGDTISLNRRDVLVYDLDLQKLAKEICAALRFKCAFEPICSVPRCWRIGFVNDSSNSLSPVHLLLPVDSTDIRRAIESIRAAGREIGLLIVPTRTCITTNIETLLAGNRGQFFVLEESLTTRQLNQWVTNGSPVSNLSISNVLPVQDIPLGDRAQSLLIAMHESGAVDSDHRRSNEEITVQAFGPTADPNQQKRVWKELKAVGYVCSKGGSGGGYWLTKGGLARAIRLIESM